MKLLHILNYKPLGTRAIDHFILEYAIQGRERGWQVSFAFTAEPPAEYAEELRTQAATWSVYRDLDEIQKLPPVDVVHTSFLSAFDHRVLKLKRSGFCQRLIVIDHSSGAGPDRDWKTPLRRLRGWRVGRTVDAVVAVSQFIARRDLERVFLPSRKVRVVPNGIDAGRFPFSLKDNVVPQVLFVGQLIEDKGVATLMEAVQRINGPLDVVIAGTGPLRATLEAAASAKVRFVGHVAEVSAHYRTADIVVIPSLWAEAFGLVAIEAMASGCVVLASDAGALPEVVGDAGMIFRKGDAVDLAAKLSNLRNDTAKRAELAKRGWLRFKEHYQLQPCVQRHLQIVEQVAFR